MKTEINSEEAKDKYGIYTDHEIINKSEIRFRLKSNDCTAYIRTQNISYGKWQKSHYHEIKETYIVQEGWIACAKLICGKITIKKYYKDDIFTIEPNEPHNIYTPSGSILHTIKHGKSNNSIWYPSVDLDKLTDKYTEEDLNKINRTGKYYLSTEYRHLDNLIWQLPLWSGAVFAILMSVYLYFLKESNFYHIKEILISISLFFFSATYYVFYRYRIHRAYTEFHNRPIFKGLSAQNFFQHFYGLLNATLLYFLMIDILIYFYSGILEYHEIFWLFGCVLISIIVTILFNRNVKYHKKVAKS
jgi:hypothetical protein